MKKIKIARIGTVPIVYTHIMGLLTELNNDERFELHLICSDGSYLNELRLQFKGVHFHVIHIPRNIELFNDLKALIRLAMLFRKEKFDIVHSHTPKAGLLTSLAGFIVQSKVRIHSFTGQVWANMKGPKKWMLVSLDKVIATLNTHNYTDSFGQRDFLLSHGVGRVDSLVVAHKGSLGGINIDRFNPDKLKGKIEKLRQELFPDFSGKVILYLGRVNRDKGIKELREAFLQLKTRHSVRLLIVGPLETMNDGEFATIIKSMQMDPDITFINFTAHPELYLGACDIFCFPSYREGFGTVALEASAMQKPVVASNIYGLSEAVEDKVSGLLFQVHDSQDLSRKLDELLKNENLAKEYGRLGRQRVADDFSEKILTQKIIADYLEMTKH